MELDIQNVDDVLVMCVARSQIVVLLHQGWITLLKGMINIHFV